MLSRTLLTALLNPKLYPHAVKEPIAYTQTHLSYVILTGPYAYKIKKAVNLGFQDFTSLSKRKHYCELECELNKVLSPDLYLGVVPITGPEDAPELEGDGPIIEYAIKMHQFPEQDLLTEVLRQDKLTHGMLDNLACQAATFHAKTEVSLDGIYGTPAKVQEPVRVNFEQLRLLLSDSADLESVTQIEQWALAEGQKRTPAFANRKAAGFVRACHGDMHMGNAVLWQGQPTFFDCIEFNESFRWTDVMGDVGFLAMDLTYNGHADLANYFVNRYFEYSGDYAGAPLLRYYMSYRAMVRAKIAGFMMAQNEEDRNFVADCLRTCRAYLDLAKKLCQPAQTRLTITHGLSGTGKSTYTKRMMQATGAVRLRSDIERKRLAGLPLFEPSKPEDKAMLYNKEMTQATFDRLFETTRMLLNAKVPVIVDAVFLKHAERARFKALAEKLDIPFEILHFELPDEDTLKARLAERSTKTRNASDATYDLIERQKGWLEPLTEAELSVTRRIEMQSSSSLVS